MTIRTRFAPSPTGNLHVGSVRTALFSWLFAKHHNGKFILRIEDTDEARSTEESVKAILEGMNWLGLDYDEGPFYQTMRRARYLEVAQQLLKKNLAYKCTCSHARLEKLREQQHAAKQKPRYDGHCRHQNINNSSNPYVIRFKNPLEGTVAFHDQVYGLIEIQQQELDDLVLIRSDGNPTYNFAVVIDDLDMQITHVIRGDDHINNTPRQINLYHALEANTPIFAHLPMILGDDGKRLSKRHGAVNILTFKEHGYLPHTILNYLIRLGWSHKDQELFSIDEMIKLFDLDQVHRGSAAFDYEKLKWMNHEYMKSLSLADFEAYHGKKCNLGLFNLYLERSKTMQELERNIAWFYEDQLEYNEDAVKQLLNEKSLNILNHIIEVFSSTEIWNQEQLNVLLKNICNHLNIKLGNIGPLLRIAITGAENAPALTQILEIAGKRLVLKRLYDFCKFVKN